MFIDNLLDQTQQMIAFMELSEKNVFNMDKFCFSYKDPENPTKQTNVAVQRDSHEFLNEFIGRLTDITYNTSRKYLVEDTFGYT